MADKLGQLTAAGRVLDMEKHKASTVKIAGIRHM